MGIVRILVVVAIGFAIFWAWKRISELNQSSTPRVRNIQSVRCAQCGVHLAEYNAIPYRSEWFCSESHRNVKHPNQQQ